MFSFFKKPSTAIFPAFSFIGTDMHNHLLPGIDDGSPDPETSVMLIEKLQALGFSAFNCSPHVISDVYPNTPAIISAAAGSLRQVLREKNLTVPLGYAAEYMVNFDFDAMVERKELLTFGKKFALIEMSYAVESPNIRDAVFNLIIKGYQPILAHPERYAYYHKPNLKEYETLLDAGCEFQLNLLSLAGYYGPPQREFAMKMIDKGWVSWLGTDLHHERHIEGLVRLANDRKAMKHLAKISKLRNPDLRPNEQW